MTTTTRTNFSSRLAITPAWAEELGGAFRTSYEAPRTELPTGRVTEKVDAVTDVWNHLELIKQVIQRQVKTAKRKRYYQERIDKIEQRAKHSQLHLAILGEFSSGKSTFINGLLRRRLLKSACVATTASATHIVAGETFSITAGFVGGKSIAATEKDFSRLNQEVKTFKPDLARNASLSYVLELLTSEPTVANQVERIDIRVPSHHLIKDVEVIDTPGIGAGDESARSHAQVTERVVETTADAALILVPSANAMSKTLLEFLATTARPFLHRCIFVITAMDNQEEKDRAEIMHVVKAVLQNQFQLSSPLVLEASAISMIPEVRWPSDREQGRSYWQARFEELEASIQTVLLRQRHLLISERLVGLLQELVIELHQELAKKKEVLADEQALLQESSVRAIQDVLASLLQVGQEKIQQQAKSLQAKAAAANRRACVATKARANEIIKETGWDIRNYAEKVAPKVQSAVERQSGAVVEAVNAHLVALRECCQEVSQEFARQFEENYKNFPSLGVQIAVPALTVSSLSKPNLNFSSAIRYTEEQNEQDNQGAGVGAVLLGIVGFCLLGPAGAAAGALAGGAGGAAVSGASLEERQAKLRSLAAGEIEAFFESSSAELEHQITATVARILKQLRRAVDAHLNEYSQAVGELIAQHHQAESNLRQQVEAINQDSLELSRRKQKLEQLKTKLLAKN